MHYAAKILNGACIENSAAFKSHAKLKLRGLKNRLKKMIYIKAQQALLIYRQHNKKQKLAEQPRRNSNEQQ